MFMLGLEYTRVDSVQIHPCRVPLDDNRRGVPTLARGKCMVVVVRPLPVLQQGMLNGLGNPGVSPLGKMTQIASKALAT